MSYLFYKSKNQNKIRKFLMNTNIRTMLIEESPVGIPFFDQKKLNSDSLTVYMMCYDLKLVGMAFFNIINSISIIDFGFLPEFRGLNAKHLAKLVLDDYKMLNEGVVIEGMILKTNKRSLHFSSWLNFKVFKTDDRYIYVRG